MKVGTDVFAGLSMYSLIRFHVLVGLKARGTSDPRKHLCKSRHSSGGRHLGLARLASARWSFHPFSRCLRRSSTWEDKDGSTCTSWVMKNVH